MKTKDCYLTLKDGSKYEFSYEDINKAIKWAYEHKIYYVVTPFCVLSLLEHEEYEAVMSLHNPEEISLDLPSLPMENS